MADVAIYATPEKLYRYRSTSEGKLDREISAIEEGYIYCPNFSSMNDPMEGAHDESSLLRRMSDYKKYSKEVKAYMEKSGIASLSETSTSEPMWAYYASNFTGICIEYNLSRLARNLPDDVSIVRMQYSEEAPTLRRNKTDIEDRARTALSTKTIRWQSEREWRVLSRDAGKLSYGADKRVVTRIFVGSRMPDKEVSEIIDRAKAIGVSIYLMKIDKYALEFAKSTEELHRTRSAEILEQVRGGKVPSK